MSEADLEAIAQAADRAAKRMSTPVGTKFGQALASMSAMALTLFAQEIRAKQSEPNP